MARQQDRILDFVLRFPGRDDDEIARVLSISPRQTVNIICRRLVERGRMQRRVGSSGKIANFPGSAPPSAVTESRTKSTPLIEGDAEGEISPQPSRRPLTAKQLEAAGFVHSATWVLDPAGVLQTDKTLPAERGVYAFSRAGAVQYVGVASMGLKKRLYFYAKPGSTQRTSQRLNEVIRRELAQGKRIKIYTATPSDMVWNGLPVNGSAGLEVGLIESFHLPWNIRGAR
jgi:hypothetical protein